MKTNGQLKAAWNTGAAYTAAGQRIAAVVIDNGNAVYFSDIDRGIDGVFPIARAPSDAYALREMTMNAYNYNNYRMTGTDISLHLRRETLQYALDNAPDNTPPLTTHENAEQMRVLRNVIERTWQQIGFDAIDANGGDMTNEEAMEVTLDADHITLHCQDDGDAREAEKAVAILKPLYRQHGFGRVVAYLSRHIQLA